MAIWRRVKPAPETHDRHAQAANSTVNPASWLLHAPPADGPPPVNQDDRAYHADYQLGEPVGRWNDAEHRQNGVQYNRADDAEDDIGDHPHAGARDLLRNPARDAAEDDREKPTYA